MKNLLFLLVALIAMASCQSKIDATSSESMQASIIEMKESLDSAKQNEFQGALTLILFQGMDFTDILSGNSDDVVTDMKSHLHGKSVDDIFEEAALIKVEIERKKKEEAAEIERKKKEEAKTEVDELYQQQSEAELDKKELAKFEVKKSRFYKRKEGTYYIEEKPIIEITVVNNTDHAISRAFFSGTLSSSGRSIPWLKDTFNYTISGGLEPGEEVTWYLAPNMFSDWGTVDAPKDAILTVDVVELEGANEVELFSSRKFDEDDAERLAELLTTYPDFLI